MKQRDRVAMTEHEVADLLAGSRKVHLATINPDGTPHLVTMYYAMIDGRIAFWTYRTSQKARNLARDRRLTCLVETGNQYFDLRGVQVQGMAQCVEEPQAVRDIGGLIAARMGNLDGAGSDAVEEYVAHAARKRVGYIVEPQRISSWDHAKLVPSR
jgi:PPOX class probable F420-dependent enzyme